jgi:hypothetical protein
MRPTYVAPLALWGERPGRFAKIADQNGDAEQQRPRREHEEARGQVVAARTIGVTFAPARRAFRLG